MIGYSNRVLVTLILLAISWHGAYCHFGAPADLLGQVGSAILSDVPQEVHDVFNSLVINTHDSKLQTYSMYDSNVIAIKMRWEMTLRTLRRNEVTGSSNASNPKALSEFISYVEGRLKTIIPLQWKRCLLESTLTKTGNLYFSDSIKTMQLSTTGLMTESDVTLSLKGGNITISGKYGIVKLDTLKRITDNRDNNNILLVSKVGEVRIVAICSSRPTPYRIYGDLDNVLYGPYKIHGAGFRGYSGQGYHNIYITYKNGLIYVYGVSENYLYIECIDIKNGACVLRFCT